MTLQEKFENVALVYDKALNLVKNNVEIADDYAIGFAQWFICYYTEEAFYEKNYIKEMLETYKKEKGL